MRENLHFKKNHCRPSNNNISNIDVLNIFLTRKLLFLKKKSVCLPKEMPFVDLVPVPLSFYLKSEELAWFLPQLQEPWDNSWGNNEVLC